jgi:hypothetical protein
MKTVFPIRKVCGLRLKAQRACCIPNPTADPWGACRRLDGWSKSTVDPMQLLSVFTSLRLKPGLVLRAYLFREGSNGNGVVWAMPEDSPFPEPAACFEAMRNRRKSPATPHGFPDFLGEPPMPPQAQKDIMNAIAGDGTPWSYLSASIFCREAGEFGAMWHGCEWSAHELLGRGPWRSTAARRSSSRRTITRAGGDWEWLTDKPAEWQPTVEQTARGVVVSFHTFSGLGQQCIYHHVDRYRRGTYRFDSTTDVIAVGPMGYVH